MPDKATEAAGSVFHYNFTHFSWCRVPWPWFGKRYKVSAGAEERSYKCFLTCVCTVSFRQSSSNPGYDKG